MKKEMTISDELVTLYTVYHYGNGLDAEWVPKRCHILKIDNYTFGIYSTFTHTEDIMINVIEASSGCLIYQRLLWKHEYLNLETKNKVLNYFLEDIGSGVEKRVSFHIDYLDGIIRNGKKKSESYAGEMPHIDIEVAE